MDKETLEFIWEKLKVIFRVYLYLAIGIISITLFSLLVVYCCLYNTH